MIQPLVPVLCRFVGDMHADSDAKEDWYHVERDVDGRKWNLGVLDTAGQEEYSALRSQWFRDGDAFLLAYCITHSKSLDDLVEYVQQVERVTDLPLDRIPIVVVGCKSDLETHREVTEEKVRSVLGGVMPADFLHLECSAKDGTNVGEVVDALVRQYDSLLRETLSKSHASRSQSLHTLCADPSIHYKTIAKRVRAASSQINKWVVRSSPPHTLKGAAWIAHFD
jgi:small GTP-binding protein